MLTAFGAAAVTFMMLMYALEGAGAASSLRGRQAASLRHSSEKVRFSDSSSFPNASVTRSE